MILDMSCFSKQVEKLGNDLTDTIYLHQYLLDSLKLGELSEGSTQRSLIEALTALKGSGSYSFWWKYNSCLVLVRNQGTLWVRQEK